MSRTYCDLSALAAAAKANDCTVHLHHDEQGRPVFSVGNSNMGAREFDSYREALAYTREAYDADDCAEQAGHALGADCLDAILAGHSQADHCKSLTKALTALQAVDHPRATAGFAVALVNVIEVGLQHLPKVPA